MNEQPNCIKTGHKPDRWTTEGNLQVQRYVVCNLIVCTAEIPKP